MVFEAHCMSFPYRTLIIQLCQGKYSFPFYGTFKKQSWMCLSLNGLSDAKFTFTCCLNINVCLHIHHIIIKIHPVLFKKSPIIIITFSDQAVLKFLAEWRSSAQAAPTAIDWHWCFTLDPPWVSCHQSTIVSPPEKVQTRMTLKRLRCFVFGCNNEHSSRHLLLISEPIKTQWITFVFKGNAPPDIPKCVYVRVNHL